LYQQGRISKRNLTGLAAAANMAGPLFVIGTVGTGLLHNTRYGYYLLAIHWVSAFIMGAVPAWREGRAQRERKTADFVFLKGSIMGRIGETVSETAELMLKVCVYIVLFSVVRQWIDGPLGALLEVTGGIEWVTGKADIVMVLVGCSFLINFSGGCVLMQSLGAMEGTPVSVMAFIYIKYCKDFWEHA
jgi:hypothetical protein